MFSKGKYRQNKNYFKFNKNYMIHGVIKSDDNKSQYKSLKFMRIRQSKKLLIPK